MTINILMPALSPTMTEGKLARWLKNKGDKVAPGDVIAEIETDKATMEVEAVDEGILADIRVAEGTENVAVNAIIAVLLEDGEDSAALTKAAAAPPLKSVAPAAKPVSTTASPVKGMSTPHAFPVKTGRIIASPLAKRIARDRGLDLSDIIGSGPGGRIVKADLEKSRQQPASQAAPTKPAMDARKLADLLGMSYKAEPNSTVRKTIARRLTEAKQTVPHFYLTIDCDLTLLSQVRETANAAKNAQRLSVNDFVIKACALALKQVPAANASWSDDSILLYDHADISVAVATDNGLITPIIRQAESKTVAQISTEMKDLGQRAKAGKLKPEEFQGGTFSVSNLGMFGIREFSAIINPPQACIMAVGAGEPRPVIRGSEIVVATMMTCTLSVDHRAVDGAVGAAYLAAFKKLIENPGELMV